MFHLQNCWFNRSNFFADMKYAKEPSRKLEGSFYFERLPGRASMTHKPRTLFLLNAADFASTTTIDLLERIAEVQAGCIGKFGQAFDDIRVVFADVG